MSLIGASFFRNPPEGYTVTGFEPAHKGGGSEAGKDYTQGEALRTPQWYLLTAILTLSVSAGISLISQAKLTATDVAGYRLTGAATLVGILAVFTGGGRILWEARSEEHTSELQSLMRISYAVFCLKKKRKLHNNINCSKIYIIQ